MPELMIAEIANLDEGTYTSMMEPLMPLMRAAKGFMSHAGGQSPAGGIRIVEIWESEEDHQKFVKEQLESNLPPELEAHVTLHELYVAFTR